MMQIEKAKRSVVINGVEVEFSDEIFEVHAVEEGVIVVLEVGDDDYEGLKNVYLLGADGSNIWRIEESFKMMDVNGREYFNSYTYFNGKNSAGNYQFYDAIGYIYEVDPKDGSVVSKTLSK